ncbi:RNA polymerase sigma-70 factor [Jiangella alkaliphila]|uniref:RNA polymerase sigma-70 factor, ECF subfamily n=1 Tax=Jiangella alkaliphila TaxID=419479 RepID=A0A1H2ICE7_9ACTN|nr:RNA polymerase sigma-70 factor [Jiangella alkaliphila]SDU41799.1 RNA polymerase sigma-70 factor, ECF subfamily [Jiangella alkaliphila]
MTDVAVAHDDLRPLMFSVAYRMLGSVSEAEDVVQEAFLRMHRAAESGTRADNPEAYATTVTTRLAIDALRSARYRREQYVGEWLPEPLLVSDDDPARRVEETETLSTAFLVVLETLTPVERAVFLLREVFGYGYDEIATIVERSEANCRQLLTRARKHIEERRPRFEASRDRRDALARTFFAALNGGDVAALEHLLAEDAVFHGDGGGKTAAVRRPLTGGLQVARFLANLGRTGVQLGTVLEPVTVNGQPGARVCDAAGAVLGVLSLTIADGRVIGVHNQINPDKLQHLGPVGDLNALLDRRG